MRKTVLEEAVRRFGTPLYLYDADGAAAQVSALRSAFGAGTRICYAVKSNPALIGPLRSSADAFEVCSPGELRICRRAGIPAEKVVLSGVCKQEQDIFDALDGFGDGVVYTAESPAQFGLIVRCAQRRGKKQLPVLLRLSCGNQFGMEEKDLFRILSGLPDRGAVQVIGIQYFSGTQKRSPDRYGQELGMLDSLYAGLKRQTGFRPQRLEYGTGLPVPYFAGEPDRDGEFTGALREALGRFSGCETVCLETGRRIAAVCGVYIAQIRDLKQIGSERYCMTDGGINQLKYDGQMLAMKRPPVCSLETHAGEPVLWSVCGSLCTANDVLASGIELRGAEIGDHLVFEKAGAYSATECLALFLSRDLPKIALYSEAGGLHLVRDSVRTDGLNG